MVQIVECLPSKCEALSSNSNTTHMHTHTDTYTQVPMHTFSLSRSPLGLPEKMFWLLLYKIFSSRAKPSFHG
jgi:hypothetical protein